MKRWLVFCACMLAIGCLASGHLLQLCGQRTESLHRTLEVLLYTGVWPQRVKLPAPGPGWAPWPKMLARGQDVETSVAVRP